jgi:hypothetical protein
MHNFAPKPKPQDQTKPEKASVTSAVKPQHVHTFGGRIRILHEDDRCIVFLHGGYNKILFGFKADMSNAFPRRLAISQRCLWEFFEKLVLFWKNSVDRFGNTIIGREGALTDYGWHAKLSPWQRHNALRYKLLAEGRRATLASLENMASLKRWGSKWSKDHDKLHILKDDIEWVKSEFPSTMVDFYSNFLMDAWREFLIRNSNVATRKPDVLFFIRSD